MYDVIWAKKHEKDVGIVTFVPDWLSSRQSRQCLYYNGIPEFMIDGNGKIAQTTQNI